MKLCKASWCRLVSRYLCAVPSVVDLDATGTRYAWPVTAKAWSRASTRSTCGYHRGCGRERWWRCRYTNSGFTMSLCVCTSASRGEEHRLRSVHTLQVQTCISMGSGGLAHGRGWQLAGAQGQNQGNDLDFG